MKKCVRGGELKLDRQVTILRNKLIELYNADSITNLLDDIIKTMKQENKNDLEIAKIKIQDTLKAARQTEIADAIKTTRANCITDRAKEAGNSAISTLTAIKNNVNDNFAKPTFQKVQQSASKGLSTVTAKATGIMNKIRGRAPAENFDKIYP